MRCRFTQIGSALAAARGATSCARRLPSLQQLLLLRRCYRAGATASAGCGGGGGGGGGAQHGGRPIPGADGKVAPPGAPTKAYDDTTLRALVRRGDYEGYLCGAFMPTSARSAHLALRAFNIEVATIRDTTRGNAQAAHLRMGFWRDFVEAAFTGGSNPHPLFKPFSSAVATHGWTREWLDRLVAARDADVDGTPPATLGALETYAEHTAGSLLLLSLETCGVRGDHAAMTAATHLGTAVGLANALRALPLHARQGQRYLPDDVLVARGLTGRDLLAASDALAAAAGVLPEGAQSSSPGGSASAPAVDPAQQAADREQLRQAALRRLAGGSVGAMRAGGTLSDVVAAPDPPTGRARSDVSGGGGGSDGVRSSSSSSSSSSSTAGGGTSSSNSSTISSTRRPRAEEPAEEEPRTLRMAGSRATAAAPGGSTMRAAAAGPPPGRAPAASAPPPPPAHTVRGGVDHTIVVGGGASAGRASAALESAPSALDSSTDGPDGRRVGAELGGFASTGNRLAAISQARAARHQPSAPSLSSSNDARAGGADHSSEASAAASRVPASASLTARSDDAQRSAGAAGLLFKLEHAAAPAVASTTMRAPPASTSGWRPVSEPSGSSPASQPATPTAASQLGGIGARAATTTSGGPLGVKLAPGGSSNDAAALAAIRLAVADVASSARRHLIAARAMSAALPHEAAPALLPAVPVARFLDRLQTQDHDIFAAGPAGPWRDTRALARLYLQLELLRHTLLGTF